MPISWQPYYCGLVALALTAGVTSSGCRTAEPKRPAELEDILAGVPDSGMRQRWRAAAAEGRLPPLDSLQLPSEPLTTRRRTQADSSRQKPPSVQIPQGSVADVRVLVTPPRDDYEGPVTVEDAGAARVIAQTPDTAGAAGQRVRFELHYQLPGGARLVQPPVGSPVTLSYHEGVEGGSQRRIVGLSRGQRIILLRVSDGGTKPYAREFAVAGVSVGQNPPGRDSVSPVTFRHGGQSFTLRPGDRRRSRDGDEDVEFFLESSYYTDPKGVPLAEGDPYHVRFLAYRVPPAPAER